MSSLRAPVPLTAAHDVSSFQCGKQQLDEFLKLHALDKQNARLSRTYVVTTNKVRVVGYHTLAHIAVTVEDAPKKIGRGMPSTIPALLLARLAVDTRYQGLGLGRSLLLDALHRTWSVMRDGAAPVRFFVVDAIDEEAKAFYERFDMLASPQNPMRQFLSYKDIVSLLS